MRKYASVSLISKTAAIFGSQTPERAVWIIILMFSGITSGVVPVPEESKSLRPRAARRQAKVSIRTSSGDPLRRFP